MKNNLAKEERPGRAFDLDQIRRLIPYLAPHRRIFLGSLLLIPFFTCVQIAQPLAIRWAIDRGILGQEPDILTWAALLYGALIVVEVTLRSFHLFLVQIGGYRVLRDLRTRIFSHVIDLAPSYFNRTPKGVLVTRTTSDVETLSEMFSSGLVSIGADLVLMGSTIVAMLLLSPTLAGLTLVLLPPLTLLAGWIRLRLQNTFRRIRALIATKTAFGSEAIAGMSVIQSFVQENRIGNEFDQISQEERDEELASVHYDSALSALVELGGSLTLALILWGGGIQVMDAGLTFGTVVAFIEYTNRLYSPLKDLSAKYSIMQSSTAASEKIFALLDVNERIADPGPSANQARSILSKIEMRGIHFGYRKEEPVLRGIDIEIRAGEVVGLVGPTGCGKSTILRLLARFHDPDRGQILLNDTDIRTLNRKDLRRQIGLIGQDVTLFRGTLEENLRLFDPTIAIDRIHFATELTGLATITSRLPQGLSTPLGESGTGLSAGERQLVAFTRALVFDPPVLLFDEATSAIDPRTEALLQDALSQVLAERTAIIVAHRPTTLQHVDRLIRIDAGQILDSTVS